MTKSAQFTLTAVLLAVSFFPSLTRAEDITMLGGEMTSSFTDRNAIQLPAPNVTDDETKNVQLSGFAVFHSLADKDEGLGPKFNNEACGSCHVNNGKGRADFKKDFFGSTMVIKVSLKVLLSDGSPQNVPNVGEQLQDHKVSGKKLFNVKLSTEKIYKKYPDGTVYVLHKPDLSFQIPGKNQKKIAYSLRMTPLVIGPGLIEAISEETVLAFSDPKDSDGDGISGRPQYIYDAKTGLKTLGRFGFKASHPSVEQQSAAAAFNDIGLSNSIFSDESSSAELSDEDLNKITVYQQLAGVPAARDQSDPTVMEGKDLFVEVGCDSCHKMTILTGTHTFSELSNQTIHPFTDLLLHNMGSGLADKRKEFEASGSEWRTTPLWGLGFSKNLSNVKARFLHDGRAKTIEEAILWHGGEASNARKKFKKLKKSKRKALLSFLNSL